MKKQQRPRAASRTQRPVQVDVVPLASLTELADNPRAHNGRDLTYLRGVLERLGSARSGVVDGKGVVLAGNGFRAAATAAGATEAIIVDSDGTRPVFVRRRNLTAAQKDELVVADNRAAQLSTWDEQLLRQYAERTPEARAGWTDAEWTELFPPTASGLTDPDVVPEVRTTSIVAGDLFELGAHRLLCGSATDRDAVTQLLGDAAPFLMVTDPPYGIDYDPAWRAKAGVNKNTRKLGKVTNDDRADWTEAWRLFPGTVSYVWHAGMKGSIVQASLEAATFTMRAQIIWAKDRLALSRGDYHWQHEPCWYAVREGQQGRRTKDRTQTTLWRIDALLMSTVWEIPSREDGGHTHGTQKPVECMARPMRNHDAPAVYDPFVGSGTSLIAAEMLARQCFALELEPTYCQVTIDRWEAFTGRKAVKVG
jgi:DNA modification methylase